jgi:hypothetical protein
MATILQEREWGRARESEGKIGQHGVTLKLHVKMSRGAFLLREGEGEGEGRKRDPLCMHYKCHSKRGKLTQGGGAHHEREGAPTRRRNSKMGEKTPSPKFKPFSNSPRGHPRCGMGPPCGPHHQMVNPMEMVSPTRDKFVPLSKVKLYEG